MAKGYVIGPDGKRSSFVEIDKQKYGTSIVWLETVAVAADSFQFQTVQIVLPSYNSIKLQEIYTVAYVNRAGGTSLVPELTYFTIAGDNSAGYTLESTPAGVSLDPVQSRFSLKGDTFIQNLGMRFTRTTVGVIPAIIKEAGLLVADDLVFCMRLVFEDVDA